MAQPKLTNLELQIMEALWSQGKASIREIQETFPEKGRPAYTTIQTTVYRLEAKAPIYDELLKLGAGGGEFNLLPCLNERDDWIRALADIARQHLAGWLIESGDARLERNEAEDNRTRAGSS